MMTQSFKGNSFYKSNSNEKANVSSPVQIKPRRSLIVCQRHPIILSPSNKSTNPEIVRPNFVNHASNNINQNDLCSPVSMKSYSSAPEIGVLRRSSHHSFQDPLEPLSPVIGKKNHSKKIRASCSVDTSWSPNLNVNNTKNNEIRKARFSYHSDDENNDNKLLFEPCYAAASDDQVSPLCNFDANF